MKKSFQIYSTVAIIIFVFLVSSCKKDPINLIPTITTLATTNITSSSSSSGGEVISDGGASITSRGVCWNTTQNPTIANFKTTDGIGIESFFSSLIDLTSNTTYFLRSYATNSIGTGYGNEFSFKTSKVVTDIDGNVYNTVTIGKQVWMVENLKVTRYRNGNSIPNVMNTSTWRNLTTGAYCDYYNDPAIGNKYGKLYNWYSVKDSRNIAPTGWHVPSDAEWTTLELYVSANLGISGSEAKALSSKLDWTSSTGINVVGNDLSRNNNSGFMALPSGFLDIDGSFYLIGNGGYWWCSNERSTKDTWVRYINYNLSNVKRTYFENYAGISVRCIMD